jgi:hypothetical protein
MSRQEILDQIYASPPEQRSQLYQTYSDTFHRPPPPPTAEQVAASQDAFDARARLASLLADPGFARRYSEGGMAERREIAELQQIIAAGADETGMSIDAGAEIVDGVSDPHSVRRHELFGALSDLNKRGIPIGALERFMDGADAWSDADYEFAQAELGRLTATPAWRDALLAGDPTARHEFEAWNMVISSRKIL